MIVFLDRLGLGHLVDLFHAEDIDDGVFWTLKEADFKELGLSLGHRRKIATAMEQSGAMAEQFNQEAPREGFELRRLSVMFIDMVGSTGLAERLSADDMHDLLQTFFMTCSDVARRFGGYVASLHGDGALVLFGYPRTRVGDAERAVNAALTMQTDLNARSYRLPSGEQVEISFRIGVATGPAIIGKSELIKVGDGLRMVGNVMNRAARLQTASPPNGVLVDQETYGDLDRLFEFEQLSEVEMKGLDRSEAFLLAGRRQSVLIHGLDGASGAEVLGREDEADIVTSIWAQAKAGAASQLLITGDPGLGKTAFIRSTIQRLRADGAHVHWLNALSSAQLAAFAPIRQHLLRLIEKEGPDADRDEVLNHIFQGVQAGDLSLVKQLLDHQNVDASLPQAAASNRSKLMSLLADWLVHGPNGQPVAIVLEDAHWADPTTVDLLRLCATRAEGKRVMLVATSRNANDPIWEEGALRASVPLQPLDRDASEALLMRASGGLQLPDAVRERLLEQSGGNPLMLESLALPLAATGHDVLNDDVVVPQTIYESVAERLDKLEEGRSFASALAVFGTDTDCAMIAAILDWPLPRTIKALDELQRAGLVTSNDSHTEICFYHQIYREVVYERIVGTSRKDLHGKALELMTDFDPDIVKTQPHLLADHAFAAGDPVVSVPLMLAAGEKFLAGSALIEATYYLEKALEGVTDLPQTSANKETRLQALAAMASVKRSRLGIAAKEVGELGKEMLDLAKDVGNMQTALLALNGLYAHALVAADYRNAAEWGAELSELSHQTQDRRFAMVGRRAVGVVALHTSRFQEAEIELRAALDAYDIRKDQHLAVAHGYDHAEICGVFLAFTLWMRGDLVGAREVSDFSIAHSRKIDHAHSLAQALSFRAMLAAMAAESGEMAEAGTEAMDIGTRFDLKVMREAGCYFRDSAWMLARSDAPTDQDIENLRASEATFSAVNPFNYGPVAKSFMARVLLAAGRVDEAIAELDMGDQIEARTGETWIRPEILRVRAAAAQMSGDAGRAAKLRKEAYALACETGAVSFALRIACDMVETDPSEEHTTLMERTAAKMVSLDNGWDVRRLEKLRQLA